jgi:ABC-type Zn uptake system ZnuABC Zn-binding protein ZnuA
LRTILNCVSCVAVRRPLPAALLALVLAAAVFAGCRDEAGGGDAQVTAVATTTQVADLVRNVGGSRVSVDGILRPNSDPHEYEPRPSDAASLARADIVFRSGGDLDKWLDEIIDNAGGDARQVTLIDSVHTIEGDNETDPHWWQNPRNTILAVDAIRAALAEADPAGRKGYDRRAAAYVRKLRTLDAAIARCVDKVPPDKRKIVTTHDALGYFAERYGVNVIGAVIPSLSTQAQASARDVDKLVNQIRDEGVEAIFPEAAVTQKLEQAISREAGAKVGGRLYADTLGPAGSGAATYLEAMRHNAAALVDGMSGGRVSCDLGG